MSLDHEFLMLTPEITNRITDDQLMVFYKNNRKSAICIHDDFILPNLGIFKDIDTVFSYSEGLVPSKGLNYYGYTIFMPNSLPKLIMLLRNILKGKEFAALIVLCEEAYKNSVAVLHCGI